MKVLFAVLRNSFFLTIAMLVDRAADFVLMLYLARFLGVDEVGEYFLVISILYLFQNLVNFGLVQLSTREIAKDTSQTLELIAYLGIVGLGLGILVTAAMLIIAPLLQYPSTVFSGLVIVAFSLLPGTFRGVVEAVFNAVERMEHIAWVTGLGGLLRSGISIGMLWAGADLSTIFIVLVVTQWLVILLYGGLLVKLFGWPRWQLSRERLMPFMRNALTFSLMSFFLVGANNIDALFLSKLGAIKDVGLYAVAFKLVQAVILFRPILMRSLFPSLVKSASDVLELQQVTQHMLRLLVLFFAPLPIILSLLAKPLILLLYGEEFVGAVQVLQVLGWSILLSYLSVALHRVLLAVNLENAALKISIVTMLINVSADVLLIPVLGAQGAAIASLLSLFIALLLTYGQIRWLLVNISPGQVWARPGFSLLLSTAITFLLNSYMSPIPLVFVFLMSYFLLLLIVKALSWNEIEALWASTRVYLMGRV